MIQDSGRCAGAKRYENDSHLDAGRRRQESCQCHIVTNIGSFCHIVTNRVSLGQGREKGKKGET